MPRAFSGFAVCLVAVLAPATARAQFNFNFGPPAQPQAKQGPAIAVFELQGTISERPGASSLFWGGLQSRHG